MTTYQYMALREHEVAARGHTCWCNACLSVVMSGVPAACGGAFLGDLVIPNCERGKTEPLFYEFRNCSVKPVGGVGLQLADKAAAKAGAKLAKTCHPSNWLVYQVEGDGRIETEEMWIGRCVARDEWDGAGTREYTNDAHMFLRFEGQEKTVRFDKGDVKVAVQWYDRIAATQDYQLAPAQPVALNNSRMLVVAGKDVLEFSSGPRPRTSDRGLHGAALAAEVAKEKLRVWTLPPNTKALIVGSFQ